MVRSLALLPLLSGLFSPVIALNRNPIQVQEPNQAQTQGHAAFPSCAVNCSLLQQAQTECADNDHATIASCFCQSSLIDQLHSSPDGVCDQVCTASDRALLHAWYGRYCSKNTKRDSVSALETPLEDTKMAPSQNFSTLKPRGGGDWWSTHYQWIIMVIVLIIGFTILTVLGVWLKRRHDAKYPHLYHGGSRDSSGLLLNRQRQSDPTLNQPGSFDPNVEMAQPRRFEGANTDSFASSSRTAITNPRTGRTPSRSRLQRQMQSPVQSPRNSDLIRAASPR